MLLLLSIFLLAVSIGVASRESGYRERRDAFKARAVEGLKRRQAHLNRVVQHSVMGDAWSSQRNVAKESHPLQRNLVEESHRLLKQGYVMRPTVVKGHPLPVAGKKTEKAKAAVAAAATSKTLPNAHLVKPHHPPHSDAKKHFVPKQTVVKGRPLRRKHSVLEHKK